MMNVDYDGIMCYLNKIGVKLSRILQNEEKKDKRLIVTFDIMKKMRNNIYVLSLLPNEENVITSKNLIYRAVFSDLMTALFLLYISDIEFKYSIRRLDVDHVKYMKEILPLRLNLGRTLFKPKDEDDISEQDLLDQYYDYFNEYLTSKKGEPWDIIKLKPLKKMKFVGTIKSLYESLLECHDNENLSALANLYLYYKYLSQTEHYSYLGNKYPFAGKCNDTWLKEFDLAIYAGIAEVENLLEQYLSVKYNSEM
ncbi:MAG: hypothetical protein BHV75_16815 [Bacteroides oleiciplenus]|nr:MAG: hypothetical protein BHV75_16815 [Bacteroides oleiciplenus]